MIHFRKILTLVTSTILLTFSVNQANAQAIIGDRDSLINLVDNYFAALVAHDPDLLPLSPDFVFVEDIKAMKAGEGLWQTASAVPSSFNLVVADPAAGTVGAIAMMEDDGKPLMIGLRLLVREGLIVEAEHVLARGLGGENLANLQTPRPGLTRTIAASERAHRDTLIGIGATYYLAVDHNLGSLSPFAEDCARRENGSQTSTNAPYEDNGDGFAVFGMMGCSEQLDTRVMSYIDSIDNVRVFAADPVTGLVMGLSHFRHSMINPTFPVIGVPGVETRTINGIGPFDLPAVHIFKISDGEIHEIEAMGFITDYNAPTGW